MRRVMDTIDLAPTASADQLEDLIAGYQKTQALYVAAKLGIPDRLAQAPQRAEALAPAIGADARALYRLLRALEFLGLLGEPTPGVFALTALGERLRSSSPQSDEVLLTGDAWFAWWGRLEHCVRTGESSVPAIEGVSSFEHLHLHPEHVLRFNRLMSAMIGVMAKGVIAAYDFRSFGTVVDIGGGRGTLLAAILEGHPRLRGILFDLPATADEARRALSSGRLADRCECVGGDFFEAVPAGDCLILSAVISDWDDERSVAILASCRRAISPQGKLLLIERLLEPDKAAPATALLDLQMLVIGGGTGRSAAEYRRLLAAAGFELARVIPTGTMRSIFEARPI